MRSTAREFVRRGVVVLGLTGGLTLLGGAIAASATADEMTAPTTVVVADETSGAGGTGSGNQADLQVDAPVDASNNQVTVIGDGNQAAGGGGDPVADAQPAADADHTSGEDGGLSGNQIEAQVEAPVAVSGNQVTVVGDGNESGGSTGSTESGGTEAGSGSGSGDGDVTSGEDGTASGNQVDVAPVVPVDVSGNQVTVIGDGNGSGGSGEAGDLGGDHPGADQPGSEQPGSEQVAGIEDHAGSTGTRPDAGVLGVASGGPRAPGAVAGVQLHAPNGVLPSTGAAALDLVAILAGLGMLLLGGLLLRRARRGSVMID